MRPRHFSYSHIVPRCTLSSITKNVLSRYNGIRFLNVKFSGPLIFSSHFDQNLFWVSFNRGRKLTKLLPCRSRFTKSQKLLCNVCSFCFPLHYSNHSSTVTDCTFAYICVRWIRWATTPLCSLKEHSLLSINPMADSRIFLADLKAGCCSNIAEIVVSLGFSSPPAPFSPSSVNALIS